MSEFTDKNMARLRNKGLAGSKDRRLYNAARQKRKLMPDGAFGKLRQHSTREHYEDLAVGTDGVFGHE